MSKLFIDANALLEVLLERPRIKVIRTLLANGNDDVYVSPLTVHLCYYYCQKEGVPNEFLVSFLEDFDVLPMDRDVVKLAQALHRRRDFEDCLQAACAELGGCDEIVTFDEKFKTDSGTKLKVTVLS